MYWNLLSWSVCLICDLHYKIRQIQFMRSSGISNRRTSWPEEGSDRRASECSTHLDRRSNAEDPSWKRRIRKLGALVLRGRTDSKEFTLGRVVIGRSVAENINQLPNKGEPGGLPSSRHAAEEGTTETLSDGPGRHFDGAWRVGPHQ